ncbi:MAG TPA: hypothetical protein VFV38_45940 [Ktedonobacteraceae bacterium]|nr:hypothetical protein [Ktedonobacteraceae bacterium]
MHIKGSPEQLDKTLTTIWSLLTEARVYEAKARTEKLLHLIQAFEEQGQGPSPEIAAHAYHVAGYTASMSARNAEALPALHCFHEMKRLAGEAQNATLSVIALSYEGDTYRRLGELSQALTCLQDAYHYMSQPDLAAHGNCAQLLARIYFRSGDRQHFEKMMEEAERIGKSIDPIENSLHGQYCLGTVYIDYARSYNQLGLTQKAFEYLDCAEEALPPSPHWRTLLIATRGILLVRNGDFQKGMPDVLEAVRLGYKHGNQRLLDRFYALEYHLNEQARRLDQARLDLSDALERSLDF